MAAKIVDRGLQVLVGRASNTADSFDEIQTLSVDDSSVAFAAGDTALDDGGAVSNQYDLVFDATPTRTDETTTHVATIPVGSGNFTIRRVSLHNAASGSVSTSSDTLIAGIDGQSLTKTSDFTMEFTITITLTDNS